MRLLFYEREGILPPSQSDTLPATFAALRQRAGEPGGSERMLKTFLYACLDLVVERADTDPDLAELRKDLSTLDALARTALAGDCDDRPLLAREDALIGRHGKQGWAARVPGRVVWLAAVTAQVPDEEGAAATMLTNDLAAVGIDLPLRALQAAARR
jgi:hypothetical protein